MPMKPFPDFSATNLFSTFPAKAAYKTPAGQVQASEDSWMPLS